MDGNESTFNIRVTPVERKPEKARLPGKIKRGYPTKLLAVFVTPQAVENIRSYACTDKTNELGGVLVGKTGKSSKRIFVLVQDYIPAIKGISRRASFEFTNEAQQAIHEIHQARYKDHAILGWFHTHPGYGVFLSGADQFIDRNYFKEPFHVAMVIDPARSDIEIGVFVWNAEGQRVRVPYFTAASS